MQGDSRAVCAACDRARVQDDWWARVEEQ